MIGPAEPARLPGLHELAPLGARGSAEVDGSDEEKLAAFRRTRQELTQRLRPFIAIALDRRSAWRERHRPVRAHLAEASGRSRSIFFGQKVGAAFVDIGLVSQEAWEQRDVGRPLIVERLGGAAWDAGGEGRLL